MQAAGAIPEGAIAPPELTRLYEGDGPVATAYLVTEAKVEQAAQRSVARWSNLRESLEARGAAAAALDAVDPVVEDAHKRGEGLAVVAGQGGLLHVEHMSDAPAADRGWWDGLPVLGPVLHERQGRLGHVIVLVDHEGADLHAVGAAGRQFDISAGNARYPVAKTAPGGWSQLRYQRRAEGSWAASAREVAAEVERVAAEVDAVQIVAAGDQRSLSLLGDALTDTWKPRFRAVEGGTGNLEREARRWVADAAARRTVALIEEFRRQLGESSRAADGAAATAGALRQGKVAVLLIHDDPDDSRRGWFGPGAGQVSLHATRDHPGEARLVDVLIRAAFQTGAGVRMVPAGGGPSEGVGAILRWA